MSKKSMAYSPGETPSVSVVLPVFNGVPYIKEAVESILNQSHKDFELICIDDGSTDGSSEILQSYASQDSRFVLLRNDSNLGLIRTLNRGLSVSRGKYIARQDADDVSVSSRLQTQFEYLELHPEIGLLGTSYFRMLPGSQPVLKHPPEPDTVIRWKLLFGNIWCHASMMFRRDLLENAGEYENFLHAEDYDLWTRMIRYTRAATVRSPLVYYRMHPSSICATEAEPQKDMTETISEREISLITPELQQEEIALIRKCYRPYRASRQELQAGYKFMLHLFRRLQERSDLDQKKLEEIRKRWMKSALVRIPGTFLIEMWNRMAKPNGLKHW